MSDTSRRCGDCKWWEFGAGGEGWCHRFPPVAKTDRESINPWTLADDWCGEFAGTTGHGTGQQSLMEAGE